MGWIGKVSCIPASIAEQAGLSLTWSKIPETGFPVTWLVLYTTMSTSRRAVPHPHILLCITLSRSFTKLSTFLNEVSLLYIQVTKNGFNTKCIGAHLVSASNVGIKSIVIQLAYRSILSQMSLDNGRIDNLMNDNYVISLTKERNKPIFKVVLSDKLKIAGNY